MSHAACLPARGFHTANNQPRTYKVGVGFVHVVAASLALSDVQLAKLLVDDGQHIAAHTPGSRSSLISLLSFLSNADQSNSACLTQADDNTHNYTYLSSLSLSSSSSFHPEPALLSFGLSGSDCGRSEPTDVKVTRGSGGFLTWSQESEREEGACTNPR